MKRAFGIFQPLWRSTRGMRPRTSGPLDYDSTVGEPSAPIEFWGVTMTGFQTLGVVTPPTN